jgi:hemoglobin
MRPEISTSADIDHLVRSFYGKALVDAEIGYLFTEIAQLDLEKHLPKIVHFWDSVLLDAPDYTGNVMQVHLNLNAKEPLTHAHFQRWLALWTETVDELFQGENAERAKQRAMGIAMVMQGKIAQLGKTW